MYKFSVWDFSEKEIEQVVELATAWATGDVGELFNGHGAIDMRKLSKNVFQWAKSRNVIQQGKDTRQYNYKTEEYEVANYAKRGGIDRWYIAQTSHERTFNPLHDLPVEAIWRMVEPTFERGKGRHTIIHSKEWRKFGIWCADDREWNKIDEWERDYGTGVVLTYGESKFLPYIKSVLNYLDRFGYLFFQYAGSVWQVTLTPERAIRSN